MSFERTFLPPKGYRENSNRTLSERSFKDFHRRFSNWYFLIGRIRNVFILGEFLKGLLQLGLLHIEAFKKFFLSPRDLLSYRITTGGGREFPSEVLLRDISSSVIPHRIFSKSFSLMTVF